MAGEQIEGEGAEEGGRQQPHPTRRRRADVVDLGPGEDVGQAGASGFGPQDTHHTVLRDGQGPDAGRHRQDAGTGTIHPAQRAPVVRIDGGVDPHQGGAPEHHVLVGSQERPVRRVDREAQVGDGAIGPDLGQAGAQVDQVRRAERVERGP